MASQLPTDILVPRALDVPTPDGLGQFDRDLNRQLVDFMATLTSQVNQLNTDALDNLVNLVPALGALIVGTGTEWETQTPAEVRALLGLDTSDNVTFASVTLGNADTTLTRDAAGDVAVEGNRLYRAGGTNVAVGDGGTGADDAAGARTAFGIGSMALRDVTISTSDPSGGADGDVWLKYEP